MRFATLSRPGIVSPFRVGPALAAGVIALMGFYGFATAVQKAAVRASGASYATSVNDDTPAAIALGPTPSLVYAVTEGSPAELAAAEPPKPAPAKAQETTSDPEPATVNLVSQPLAEDAAKTIEVATNGPLAIPPAPSVSDYAADAAARQPPPPAATAGAPVASAADLAPITP